MNTLGYVVAVLIAVSGTGLQSAVAAGPNFTAGTIISNSIASWDPSAAIDGSGNAVAIWDDKSINQIRAASHPLSGSWSAGQLISAPLQSSIAYPSIHTSSTGNATAVWDDAAGVWAADRTSTGTWSTAKLILPGVYSIVMSPIFVMNAQGDAAILWASGGTVAPTQLNAIRRTAGQWGAQQIVSTGITVSYENAVLADNGDLLATWETYTVVCKKHCTRSNYVLHASRELRGSTMWQDSGALTAAGQIHLSLVAADAQGRASVVYVQSLGVVAGTTQQIPGSSWSAPVVIFSASGFVQPVGLGTDSAWDVTLALVVSGQLSVVNGQVTSNTWGASIVVSGSDSGPNAVVFATNASGGAVLSWATAGQANAVHAAVRQSATGAWSAPQSISPAGIQMAAPNGVAMNAAGNGVVVFEAYNAALSAHNVYASTF